MTVDSPNEPQWPATCTGQLNGTKVDLVQLVVVNLKNLLEKDQNEAHKLYEAAQSPGFFLLDVRDTTQYAADLQAMYAMTEKYFAQPEETKMRDFMNREFRGYKSGKYASSLEFSRDEFLQQTAILPEILQADAALVERFTLESHDITYALLSSLSDSLGLDGQDRIENRYPSSEPSPSSMKVATIPTVANMADYPDTTHTDGGLITINCLEQWGTQIELPWNKQWMSIEPKPGHCVVNVADTLQSLSGYKLHSCLHRVTQLVDGVEKRPFVGYFLRPGPGREC